MTDSDLTKIEVELGIVLPDFYKRAMRSAPANYRNPERVSQAVLFRADDLIALNRNVRGAEYEFEEFDPDWTSKFFLIGDNGAGDYFSIRLDRDDNVWIIGTDCGEPHEVNCLIEELFEGSDPWQHDRCPVENQFKLLLGRKRCEFISHMSRRPISTAKLKQLAIDWDGCKAHLLTLVASLAKCEPSSLSVLKETEGPTGSIAAEFDEPTVGDARWSGVGGQIYDGLARFSLFGSSGERPEPQQLGIDWRVVRNTISALLDALHPGYRASVSFCRDITTGSKMWEYQLKYSIYRNRDEVVEVQ